MLAAAAASATPATAAVPDYSKQWDEYLKRTGMCCIISVIICVREMKKRFNFVFAGAAQAAAAVAAAAAPASAAAAAPTLQQPVAPAAVAAPAAAAAATPAQQPATTQVC